MSKKARNTTQQFSSDKIVPQFIELYKRVIQESNTRE